MSKDEQTVEEIMNLLKFASMEGKENVSLKLDGLACKTIYKYIKSLRSTIENLSLDTDRWFKSSVNKQKQYVELERKTDEIIDNLITALSEENGEDEEELYRKFVENV